MSQTDFIPRRESDFRKWSANFSAKLTAYGPAIGVSAELIDDYRDKHNAFNAAYLTAITPSTRTSPSITAKNTALKVVRAAARKLAWAIHAQKKASVHQLSALGLTINRPGGRSPRTPRPRSKPEVIIEQVDNRRVTLRLRNLEEPTRRGRPPGVRHAVLLRAVGDTPPSNPRDWSLVGLATRTRYTTTLPLELEPGERVWFTAYWVNTRGQNGPIATPAQTGVMPIIAPVRTQSLRAAA